MDRSDDDDDHDDHDVEMLSSIARFDRRRYCSFDEWGKGGKDTEKHDFYIIRRNNGKNSRELYMYFFF